MTNSFQPQARPVNTFVQPSVVAPSSGVDDLLKILQSVNPGLNKFLDNRIDTAIEAEQAEGVELALEASKNDFKNYTKSIKKKDGEEAARQLIGGSIFAQRAFEKTKTKLLAGNYSNKVTTLYQGKTYTIPDEDGNEINQPITHFSPNSPQFQDFLQEVSQIDVNHLENMNPVDRITFYESQSKAVQKITAHHLKEHNIFKFNRLKNQSVPVLWQSFQSYRNGNTEQALKDINEYVNENVMLGLTADKQTQFFNSLIDTGKSVATRAYARTEGSFAAKENALDDAINMISEISHGPGGKDKLRNHPDFETKMYDLRTKLSKESDRLIKRKKEKEEAAENFTIEEFVRKYAVEPDALERLVEMFPERKDYILERIELDESDRTQRFKKLEIDIASGEINREDGLKELAQLRTDIGSTFTNEDDENYKRVLTAISTYKSIDDKFNSRLTKTIQDGHRRMGSIDPLIGAYDDVNVGKDISELNVQLRRDMIDTIELDPKKKLSPREKEKAYRDLEDQYFKDIEALREKYKLENLGTGDEEAGSKGKDKGKDDEGGFSNFMELLKKGLSTTTPGGGSPATAGDLQDKLTSYTVKAGDTLSELAGQFKTTTDEIKEANNITDEDFINIGQSLLMPINTIGDALVPESDLQNPSVLDEIDVTQPFTFNSLERLAQEVGFPPEDARIAAAIALAESNGDAQIDTVASGLDPNKENEYSFGLWQINVIDKYQAERFPLFNITKESELYDPLTNAKAAKILYDRAGGSFEDWSTYTSGKYKDYLPKTN
tara:strand:- start:938 stop:3274 length:2337 start_codon:yes stop_codon:yes gene_type:complete